MPAPTLTTIVSTALLTLVLAGTALAQGGGPRDADDERARVLYENGAILYEEGLYEDAIEAWEEAFKLSDRPLFLFNIANALERVGRWDDALDYLNRYRAFAPADERNVLERRMRNIERRLDKARETARESANERAEREAEDQARRDQEEARRRAEEEAARRAEDEAQAETAEPVSEGRLIAGVVLIGAGVGVIAAGGALSGLALGARAEALALCKDVEGALLCPAGAAGALQQDERLSLGSDALFAIGAGVATTGVILIVLHLAGVDDSVASGPVHLSPTGGPTGLGIGVRGSFR